MGIMAKRKFERELPKVGTTLIGKFKGKIYKAMIVKDDNLLSGRGIRFKNKTYKSMTATATSITNNSINGWLFWRF